MTRILRTDIHLTDWMVLLGILLGLVYVLIDMTSMVLTDRTGESAIMVLFGHGWHDNYHHIAIFCAFVIFGIYAQIIVNKDKDIERALREDWKRLRDLADSTFDGMVVSDKGRILELNDNFAAMFGYKPIELVGGNTLDLVTMECRYLVQQRIQAASEEPYEATGLRNDGSTFPMEVLSRNVQFNGNPARISAIRDITERRRSVAKINRKMEFVDIILRIASRFGTASHLDAAISASLAEIGTFSGASRAFVLQYREDGTLMDNTYEWCAEGVTPEIDNLKGLPRETFSLWLDNIEKAGDRSQLAGISQPSDENIIGGEWTGKRGVGSVVGVPLYADGEIAGFIGFDNILSRGECDEDNILIRQIFSEILEAVLERKQASEAILENEDRYRKLIEISFDGFIISDRTLVLEASENFAKMFGYETSEIVGKSTLDLVAPECRDVIKRAVQSMSEKPFKVLGLRKDGTLFGMEVVGGNIRYKGRPARIAAVRATSERETTEERHTGEREVEECPSVVPGPDP